jgi:hypothetical protein
VDSDTAAGWFGLGGQLTGVLRFVTRTRRIQTSSRDEHHRVRRGRISLVVWWIICAAASHLDELSVASGDVSRQPSASS